MRDLKHSTEELDLKAMSSPGGGFIHLDTDGQQSIGGGVGGGWGDGFWGSIDPNMPGWMLTGSATNNTALMIGGLVALGLVVGAIAWAAGGRRKK